MKGRKKERTERTNGKKKKTKNVKQKIKTEYERIVSMKTIGNVSK